MPTESISGVLNVINMYRIRMFAVIISVFNALSRLLFKAILSFDQFVYKLSEDIYSYYRQLASTYVPVYASF